jgi:hypothetical protein
MRPSRRRVIGAVASRLFPYLVEATIIPTSLFYVLLLIGDMRWALAGALAWSYGAIVRRAVRGRPVPGLLILATIGITVRTIVDLPSDNDLSGQPTCRASTLDPTSWRVARGQQRPRSRPARPGDRFP